MSTSEPRRSLAACPSTSRSQITRCPWRSMRNTEPTRAPGAIEYSERSVSRTTVPSPVPGSYALTTPCICPRESRFRKPCVVFTSTLPEGIMVRESSLIGRLRARLPSIGDDAAVVVTPPGQLILCADASVAGVHADLGVVGVDDLGWKALVTALSDIAAMGGRPSYALVTVSGPLGDVDVDLLYDGLLAAADAYGCPVVGGDLAAAPAL